MLNNAPWKNPLVRRLLYGVVCINLVFYTLGLLYLYKDHKRYTKQASATTENLAKILEINYEGRLEKINIALSAVGTEAERQIATGRLNVSTLNAYMIKQRTVTPELEGIWLADKHGIIRYGTQVPSGKPIDISDREYFARQSQGSSLGLVISKPVMGRITRDWSILLSRRINYPDGSFAGIALGSLPFVKDFSSMFTSLDVGPHGSLTLRDGTNDLATILRYTPKGVGDIASPKISTEIVKQVRNNPVSGTYTALSVADNVERLFTHRKVGKYPWYVFVGISTDDYLGPWRKEAGVLLSLLTAFTVATIFFTRSVMLRLQETISKELAQERSDKLQALVREQATNLEIEKLALEAATQRQQAAEALSDSQNLLYSIINSTPDLIWAVEPETFGVTAFNKSIEEYFFKNFGFQLEIGMTPAMLFPSEDFARAWEGYYHVAIQEGLKKIEYNTYAGGLVLDLNFNAITRDGVVTGISVFARDITGRVRAEKELSRLNRELKAISDCNQVLIRAEDEQTLLNDICKIVCEKAGYRMAWAGYAEHDEHKTVRPVAIAGVEEGYLSGAKISWADTESGQGPTGTAIRTGQTVYTQDLTADPRMTLWRDNALQRGYRSSIALPLKNSNGTTFGALMIYSVEINAITSEEQQLLERLADDLAFGICTLRARKEHDKAKEELHNTLQRLELATASARMGVWDWNLIDNTMVWDERMLELYGYTRQSFVGGLEAWERCLYPEDYAEVMELCQAALRGEKEYDAEFRIQHPDGTVKWIKANGLVIHGQGNVPIRMLGINRDITERKFVESNLRASEARMITAIEIAGLYLYERTGAEPSQRQITFPDNRMQQFLDIPSDQKDRVFDFWLERIHPDDLHLVYSVNKSLDEQGENLDSLEYRFYHDRRGWIWIRHVVYALSRDADGKVNRLVGALQEVTEQKRRIEEIQQNEARLSSLLRISQYPYANIQDLLDFTLSEAISLTESKIGYIYHYDETLRRFTLNTWSKDVMKECGILEPSTTYDLDATGLWGEAVRQRRPIIVNDFYAENPHRKGYPEGHAPLHSFLTVPVFSKNSIVAVVGVANKCGAYDDADVQQLSLMMDAVWRMVEQDRLDRAFLAAEAKYRTLLESIELIAVILDTTGSIIFCNNYLLNLTGWSGDEVLGKNWFDMFLPTDVKGDVAEVFSQMLQSNISSHYENRIVCKNGKERTISWSNTFIHDANGTIIGVASIGSDLTEQLVTEAQLRQAQKMESIGQLAGGVAHDFNNILAVISGYCQLLIMNGKLDFEQKDYLDQINLASTKAAQLTQALLAFSRRQTMVFRQENLNDIVQHVHKFLARIIGEDIKLHSTCCDINLSVYIDKGQIEQVFMNLATNARDAMPNGGTITVKTDLVDLDSPTAMACDTSMPPGQYAVVTVSDTGSGIPKEQLNKIFEPFFTTKEVGKGTGLGMSIIYGIVKQHNGFINVYSEVGIGTTFRIYLPITNNSLENSYDEQIAMVPAVGGTETILIVEDDPAVRCLLETILNKYGYTTILAKDGQDAVDTFTLHQDSISLIIMDVIMPNKNGREAYDEISLICPDKKVLYLSGYAADFLENRGISDKGIELMMKPVHPTKLLCKIRQMLDHVPGD